MDFKLPDIGEGIHEGEITKWLVSRGEKITADQPMVEVMTDKATVEIPSPVAGVVEELMVAQGETIEVGKTIIRIREEKKLDEKGFKKNFSESEVNKDRDIPIFRSPMNPQKSDEVINSSILATPATRQLARTLGIELKNVRGTGPHGRVTKLDIQMAYEGQQAAVPRSSHPKPTEILPTIKKESLQPSVSRGTLEKIPLKGIRKRISEAMSHSKRTAAHFTYVEEVDMTEIVRLRKEALKEAEKRSVKLTYLPFIIKAVIPALQEFPYLNSSLDDEKQEIVLKGDYNIGIATDTPQGLMVPVIKGADRKTIWEIASEITDLSEKARSGKIGLDDLRGGTFTLTNAGSIGGVFATPVINHPEVGILGVNAIRQRPVVKDNQIVIRDMMFLSISVDHRVVDGADAARFMNRLVYFLSEPTRLVFV